MPEPSIDNYGYESKSGRYRSLKTGRYVTTQDVRDLRGNLIAKKSNDAGMLSDKVAAGTAPVSQYQNVMISYIRNLNTSMFILGRGGIAAMTPNDWVVLGRYLEGEYVYLENFMADIENGNLTAGQIRSRAGLYVESSWTAYSLGESEGASAAGYTEERRIAVDDQGTCSDCSGYAALDWQPIGSLPKPGEKSRCQRRCRCYFEYRSTAKNGRVTLREAS